MGKPAIFRHYLTTAISIFILTSFFSTPASALEITRYVSATGTGDGLTPENPTSNLESVLSLGKKVDCVIILVTPGIYDIKGSGIEDAPYQNVHLYGVNNFVDRDNPGQLPPQINCPHASFLHSIVGNVDFSGSLGFQSSQFSYITAGKHIHAYVNDNEELLISGVNCTGFTFENYNGLASIRLFRCNANGGTYGLQSKHADVTAVLCRFSNCKAGGVSMDTGRAYFEDCEFLNNAGNGGAFVWSLDQQISSFKNCFFMGNTTDDRDRGAGLTVLGTGVMLSNCVFDDNKGAGRMADKLVGAFRCFSSRFYVESCLFTDNAGGVMTNAYPGENRLTDISIQNTAFFKNGEDIIAPNGFDITRSRCATDHGSGIPELDSQEGLVIVNGKDMCGDNPAEKYLGIYWDGENNMFRLAENSCLINAGMTQYDSDYYGTWRTALGGSDIGPFEYTGILSPDYSIPPVKFGKYVYRYVVSKYKDKEHYFLADIPEGLEEINRLPWGALYVGEKSLMPERYGDTLLTYQVVTGNKNLLFFKNEGREWKCVKTIPYTGSKPVIKKSVAKKNTLVITADGKNYNYEY